MRIALTGNPNSGKTTMFNAFTGSTESVGNWAGVTVDKKEQRVKKAYYEREELIAVDLPGAYSMSPFTSEESIASDYVKNENPDVIINIVDATNLSRSLFFTTQLLELGIPTVVALNKSDINEKKETKINIELLSQKLCCPVVETVSTASDGLKMVIETAVSVVGSEQKAPYIQKDVDLTNKAAVEAADIKRFDFVNQIVKEVESRKRFSSDRTLDDKIDSVLTNKWFGIPIFAAVMFLVFQISQVWVGAPVADALVGLLEGVKDWIASLLSGASPLLSAILVDGVIGGVIAVVGFLPLVMVMYFFIALLEDCGYMARVAVILDPIFKKVGLSGKSVISFVITVGCAVPGIMAGRTIRNERERRATAMLAPFMPCGAKIPVIALFAGAFFDDAGWVSTLMYLSGIVLIFFGALLINGITGHRAKKSYFIIEIPEYKIPSFWGAFKSMCARGWAYVVKAATIILLCNMAVQIMQEFTWNFDAANQTASDSILASIAGVFGYLIIPIIGIFSWQLAAATITGFIAKENVVGTLAVCYAVTEFSRTDMIGVSASGSSVAITSVAALAFLMFNLFSPPCFAAIAAMSSEMKSAKWFWGGLGLQLAVGYTVAYLVYTVGTLITAPETLALAPAVAGLIFILAVAVFITVLIVKASKSTQNLKTEYTLD